MPNFSEFCFALFSSVTQRLPNPQLSYVAQIRPYMNPFTSLKALLYRLQSYGGINDQFLHPGNCDLLIL